MHSQSQPLNLHIPKESIMPRPSSTVMVEMIEEETQKLEHDEINGPATQRGGETARIQEEIFNDLNLYNNQSLQPPAELQKEFQEKVQNGSLISNWLRQYWHIHMDPANGSFFKLDEEMHKLVSQLLKMGTEQMNENVLKLH